MDDVVKVLFASDPYFRAGRGEDDAPPDALLADYARWKEERLFKHYVRHCMNRERMAQSLLDSLPITLPNARKGAEYSCTFTLPAELVPQDIEGLEALGLRWAPENDIMVGGLTISGAPLEAGDHEIVLRCSYPDWTAGRPLLKRALRLIVNPDPDDLWNDIPTDPAIEYFKPDADSAFVPVGAAETAEAARTDDTAETAEATEPGEAATTSVRPERRLLAASVRGRSHAHEGRPRDDHFLIRHNPESGWSLLAVADGAGSAPYSREGSRIACETALRVCEEQIDSPAMTASIRRLGEAPDDPTLRVQTERAAYSVLGQAALQAHQAIRAEAKERGRDKRDYATTLLLALCKQFDFGLLVASFGVGDGAMAVLTLPAAPEDAEATPAVELLAEPDEGEFGGQTRFLTMDDIFRDYESLQRRIRVRVLTDRAVLSLMTDGVADPKFESDADLRSPEKWAALWEELNRAAPLNGDPEAAKNALLDWLTFRSPGHHDDRTLALFF